MSLELDANYIAKKNLLADAGAWVWLIALEYTSGSFVRVAANQAADIVWNGFTWQWMPVMVGDLRQERGALPTMELSVCNIGRFIQAYAEQYNGLADCPATLVAVHTAHLTVTANLPTYNFVVVSSIFTPIWARLNLSVAPNPFNVADPRDKWLKNFCAFNFPHSADARCPYTGTTYTTCDRTLSACIVRNGAASYRFGGAPAIGNNRGYV